jgi:hypothetical protein
MAKASLRKNWAIADEAGAGAMTDAEIDLEISLTRAESQRRKAE